MRVRCLSLCLVLVILAGCASLPPLVPATPAPSPATSVPPAPPMSSSAAATISSAPTVAPAPAHPTAPPAVTPAPSPAPSPTETGFSAAVGAAAKEGDVAGGVIGERMSAQIRANPFSARAPAGQAGEDNALIILFPELRTAPPPAWLAEGARVTYYIQTAGPVQKGPDDKSSFGAGFMQYDLVSVQARSVRAAWKFFLIGSGNAITPSGAGISRGIPGAGEYWVQPAVLENAERVANNELVVIHMPTTISGRTYQAVRFEYRPAGATYVWVYDATSGVLLFYRHTLGPEDNPRQSAQMIFQARRTLNVPWRRGSAPAWARRSTLQFEGAIDMFTFGSPTARLPVSITARPQGGTSRYVEYSLTQYTSGQLGDPAERVTGAGQLFDGLWLPPEALGTVTRQIVLDVDPVTRSQVTAAADADGSVVLTEAGPAYSTVLTYDGETGVLLSMEQETNVGTMTTRTSLRLSD